MKKKSKSKSDLLADRSRDSVQSKKSSMSARSVRSKDSSASKGSVKTRKRRQEKLLGEDLQSSQGFTYYVEPIHELSPVDEETGLLSESSKMTQMEGGNASKKPTAAPSKATGGRNIFEGGSKNASKVSKGGQPKQKDFLLN